MSEQDRIPDEAVDAAARALYKLECGGAGWRPYAEMPADHIEEWREQAREALGAALPIMLSHEREETRLAHLDAVVNAGTVDELQAKLDRVEDLAYSLHSDYEYMEHSPTGDYAPAKDLTEAEYGLKIAARINSAITAPPNSSKENTMHESAIKAVLKLHKPEEWDAVYCSRESGCEDCYPEFYDEGAGHEMTVCTECVGVTDDDEPGKVPYPCPTVRAINKALTPCCPDEQSACSSCTEPNDTALTATEGQA